MPSDVDFLVLGPLEVRVDGREAHLGRPRLRTLLLALLVAPGRMVTSERLLEAVWEERPPATGIAALHTLVATLRAWLATAAATDGRDLLRTRPGGYLLAIEPRQLDAHRFEGLAVDGARAVREGRADEGAALLDDALGLWRGPALADVASTPFASATAAHLEERRTSAEEDRAEADLCRHRSRDAAARLERLVVEEPLRERRWALYITALYRDGRQRDALAAYQRVRALLRDELGIDPGRELRRLHDAVLRQDSDLLGDTDDPPSPSALLAPRRAVRTQPLPEPVSSFIGRSDEVAAISRLLARCRLVTLTGAGGVGKTRLALAAARGLASWFPAGTAFVPLGGLRDPDGVIGAIARSLGLREDMAAASTELIAERLHGERVLVVLDTLEHLLAAREQIAALLSACGGLTVLATSRTPLALAGERRYRVPPLALPGAADADPEAIGRVDAVALFVDRASAIDPDFALDETRLPHVVAWCRLLGGLPLALELAAARAGDHGEDLLGRAPALADLAQGPVDAPERQRTMRATLDWSVGLLTARARNLLAQLSVFHGAPDAAAVTAVAGETSAAVDELVASGLVARRTDAGPPRYVLLEIVREYAAELLDEGSATAAAGRHAVHFLARAEEDRPALGRSDSRSLEALDHDADDLRAAIAALRRAGELEAAARFVTALYRWWRDRGDAGEGRRLTAALLDEGDGLLGPHLVAELTTCLGFLEAAQGRYDDAAAHFEAAGEEWTLAGSTAGRARALYGLGGMRYRRQAYPDALALLEEALRAARAASEQTVEENALAQLASLDEARGDWAAAQQRYQEAEVLALARGRLRSVAQCRACRAALVAVDGDPEGADELARSALEVAEGSGSRPAVAFSSALGGVVALERGDGAVAEERYQRALDVCLETGLRHWALDCIGGLAAAAAVLGEPARAARLFAAADAAFQREGIPKEPGPERESHERCRRSLWSLGSTAVLERAAAEGARLDLDDAVRLARREGPSARQHATVTPLRGRPTAARR